MLNGEYMVFGCCGCSLFCMFYVCSVCYMFLYVHGVSAVCVVFSVVCIFELFMWCWLYVVSAVNMWYMNGTFVVLWGLYGVHAICSVCVSCMFCLIFVLCVQSV